MMCRAPPLTSQRVPAPCLSPDCPAHCVPTGCPCESQESCISALRSCPDLGVGFQVIMTLVMCNCSVIDLYKKEPLLKKTLGLALFTSLLIPLQTKRGRMQLCFQTRRKHSEGDNSEKNSQLMSSQPSEIPLDVPNLSMESSTLYSRSHWMDSELTMSQCNQILQSSLWFIYCEVPGPTYLAGNSPSLFSYKQCKAEQR